MIQDIVTILIVAFAFGYTLYSIYGIIFPSKAKAASGCGGCSGCTLKDVSYNIKNNKMLKRQSY